MFADTIKLFADYSLRLIQTEAIPASFDQPPRELVSEVVERLRQLDYIITRVRELEGATNGARTEDKIYLELRTLSGAFYYVAARTRSVLRSGELPGLKPFECPGVRNVRNHLLEHPEGRDSRVFTAGFGFGGAAGPGIKAVRRIGQEGICPDAGLYANAQEFKDELERQLHKYMETAGA